MAEQVFGGAIMEKDFPEILTFTFLKIIKEIKPKIKIIEEKESKKEPNLEGEVERASQEEIKDFLTKSESREAITPILPQEELPENRPQQPQQERTQQAEQEQRPIYGTAPRQENRRSYYESPVLKQTTPRIIETSNRTNEFLNQNVTQNRSLRENETFNREIEQDRRYSLEEDREKRRKRMRE